MCGNHTFSKKTCSQYNKHKHIFEILTNCKYLSVTIMFDLRHEMFCESHSLTLLFSKLLEYHPVVIVLCFVPTS